MYNLSLDWETPDGENIKRERLCTGFEIRNSRVNVFLNETNWFPEEPEFDSLSISEIIEKLDMKQADNLAVILFPDGNFGCVSNVIHLVATLIRAFRKMDTGILHAHRVGKLHHGLRVDD